MYVTHMSKMIQIRNVPDHIHRLLKMRAAEAGMSLSEFLVREVSLIADRPSLDEILKRIKGHGSISPSEASASAVRAEREARF
jgi:antitoxin FitA